MIPTGVQVFVALEPVDLRCGFDRLAALARDRIGYDARSGALFVFVGRRGSTAKALFFDGTGLCLVHKRLDRGTFRVPMPPADGATHLEIDEAAFEALFDGLPIAPEPAPTRASRRRVH
ncbi:MAG: IS66 family insertion sequence element accessory protein TnpB [Polyangiales bacterium]